jgi:SAM-dependent methyltransferase
MKKVKKPWSTKATMEQIYEKNLWGGNPSDFYSGEGSHLPEIINPYIAAVSLFLTSFDSPLTVCDLGCGDFNVGKELVKFTKKYIAVDIVEALIAYNKKKFRDKNLEFLCLDIAEHDLPKGDCVLLRQVLQHLSNAEVQKIARKLVGFKYIIVTEHIPTADFIPNEDLVSGQGIRLKKQSGINLVTPPFNMKIKEEKQIVLLILGAGRGRLLTTLYKMA